MVDGAKKVRIMGEEIGVRAHIYNLDGLSAHADREDIIDWLGCFVQKPANIFLVHGEVGSAEALASLIREKLSLSAYIPQYGDMATFRGREWRVSTAPGLPTVAPAEKELLDVLNELDSEWVDAKQRLENLVAADAAKMPAVVSRLIKVRKFVRKTLGDL